MACLNTKIGFWRRTAAGAISLGGFLLLALGLLDDRRALPASIKLVVQGLAAALAVFWGGAVLEFAGPGVSVVVSLLWIVAVTNAINFIDNMDGLAGAWICGGARVCLRRGLEQPMARGNACGDFGRWFAGVPAVERGPRESLHGRWWFVADRFFVGGHRRSDHMVGPRRRSRSRGRLVGLLVPLGALAIPLYDLVAVSASDCGKVGAPLLVIAHLSHRLVQRDLWTKAVFALWLLAAVLLGWQSRCHVPPRRKRSGWRSAWVCCCWACWWLTFGACRNDRAKFIGSVRSDAHGAGGRVGRVGFVRRSHGHGRSAASGFCSGLGRWVPGLGPAVR